LLNDAAVKLGKIWIYGAAVGAHGVQMTIIPGQTPCLRCVFPEMPAPGTSPTCDTAGVVLPIIATIASYQVAETIKILTGQFEKLHGSLLQFDLWQNSFTRLKLRERTADCPTCQHGNFEFLTARGGQLATTLCGRNSVQITPASPTQIDFPRMAEQLRDAGDVSYNRFLLRLKTAEHEITVFADARSIVKGTDDPAVARTLYARYIGA
ncbi:MAG: ThiF family adenylyltransferase, partial [Acidobacteriota bacterium]